MSRTDEVDCPGQGRHITRAADEYAKRTGDTLYPTALQLFIEEEHRHAALLGKVLDVAGIPRIRRQWAAGRFPALRHPAGLGTAICLLLAPAPDPSVFSRATPRGTGAEGPGTSFGKWRK